MDYLTEHDWGVRVRFSEIAEAPNRWRSLMYRAKVLVITGLHLEKDQLWDLHSKFGRPWAAEEYRDSNEKTVQAGTGVMTEYGNLVTKAIGNMSMPWHRDIPWHREKRYPIRSLYPTTLTLGAGNAGTEFADCNVLLKRLSFSDRDKLRDTELVIQNWYEVQAGAPEVHVKVIPLVEKHPVTGVESVMLNSFLTNSYCISRYSTVRKGAWIVDVRIGGKVLPYDEAVGWLDYLHSLATTRDNIYTHRWELGDLVLFDNFSGVFHRRDAINAPEGAERRFYRMNLHHVTDSAI